MAAMSENTAANKKHWNAMAAKYDTDPKWEKPIAQLVAAVRERREFLGVDWVKDGDSDRTVRMIDYACGPGTISRALYPYVTQRRGIDLSSSMVAMYKARARVEGLTPQQMDAFEGNILDGDEALSDPSLRDADLACISMAMHHMDDPALAVLRLVERLRPGGVLFVVEFLRHEVPEGSGAKHHHHHHHHGGHGHGHGHSHGGGKHEDQQHENGLGDEGDVMHTITHKGFSPEQVKDIFEKAGAGDDFAFEIVESVEMPAFSEVKPVVFFARGTKKAGASL